MKRALSVLFPLLVFVILAQPVFAQEVGFITGENLNHFLSVCLDKQDAIDILETDRKSGAEAAEKVWQTKERCANVPVQGYSVGKIVYSVKSKREGGSVITSAVEILLNGKVTGYFLTTAPVNKAQRNS